MQTETPLVLEEVELSGWWRRAAAYTIDSLIISLLVIGVALLAAGLFFASSDSREEALEAFILEAVLFVLVVFVAQIVIATLYWGLSMKRPGKNNGQSPAQQMLGIRVARLSGKIVTFWWALFRQIVVLGILLAIVGAVASTVAAAALGSETAAAAIFYLPYAINFLWPLWDPINQAIHDKIAESVVLRVATPLSQELEQ